MGAFDDKYGKGSLERVRAACELPGWETAEIDEFSASGFRFTWSGEAGTASCFVTWVPDDDRFEWSRMEVDPPSSGFLTELAKSLPQVLLDVGVTTNSISGGGRAAFARIGFVLREGPEREQWEAPQERIVEYGDFAKGEGKEPGWHKKLDTE